MCYWFRDNSIIHNDPFSFLSTFQDLIDPTIFCSDPDIFCVSEGAVGNIKGDMHVTGTTEDGHQNYYDMRNSGTLNVAGNVSFEGTNNLHVFDKSELNVGKNATFNEG